MSYVSHIRVGTPPYDSQFYIDDKWYSVHDLLSCEVYGVGYGQVGSDLIVVSHDTKQVQLYNHIEIAETSVWCKLPEVYDFWSFSNGLSSLGSKSIVLDLFNKTVELCGEKGSACFRGFGSLHRAMNLYVLLIQLCNETDINLLRYDEIIISCRNLSSRIVFGSGSEVYRAKMCLDIGRNIWCEGILL